eukprot:981299-Rhodomonas_salina.1
MPDPGRPTCCLSPGNGAGRCGMVREKLRLSKSGAECQQDLDALFCVFPSADYLRSGRSTPLSALLTAWESSWTRTIAKAGEGRVGLLPAWAESDAARRQAPSEPGIARRERREGTRAEPEHEELVASERARLLQPRNRPHAHRLVRAPARNARSVRGDCDARHSLLVPFQLASDRHPTSRVPHSYCCVSAPARRHLAAECKALSLRHGIDRTWRRHRTDRTGHRKNASQRENMVQHDVWSDTCVADT